MSQATVGESGGGQSVAKLGAMSNYDGTEIRGGNCGARFAWRTVTLVGQLGTGPLLDIIVGEGAWLHSTLPSVLVLHQSLRRKNVVHKDDMRYLQRVSRAMENQYLG